jgi:SAM-dependent methyltransferase
MSEIDYSIHYSRFHDGSPENYDRMAKNLGYTIDPLLPLDKSARILDIGCGFGFALYHLKQLGYSNAMGLDASAQQAARARAAGLHVEHVLDTADWLNAHPKEFSVVILLDVLEHLPKERQLPLLAGIHHALQKDGLLIVQVPNANSILASRWLHIDWTHTSSFTEYSLHFVLANAAFDQITISSEKGLARPSLRIWHRDCRRALRKFLVRWLWKQVFISEGQDPEEISFELNLLATARKR